MCPLCPIHNRIGVNFGVNFGINFGYQYINFGAISTPFRPDPSEGPMDGPRRMPARSNGCPRLSRAAVATPGQPLQNK